MRILVFAPHNDDEVLGVGGTIAKFARASHEIYVCEVTSGEEIEKVKRIQAEALKAHEILGVKETIFLGLPVVALKDVPTARINKRLLEVVEKVKPNIVFIPHKGDIHIDHKVVASSALVALRPVNNPELKAIYAYETLSETEWNTPTVDNVFIPNVWCEITDTIELKLKAMECYKTQIKSFPHPRSTEAIKALAKFRGSTICVPYAESFMLVRSII
ncbi:MAG TPA: PIG-L family deacetylase [Tissierellia bacterium]|nr:PIG-L family deacetylase [Tissierellia bacterium]